MDMLTVCGNLKRQTYVTKPERSFIDKHLSFVEARISKHGILDCGTNLDHYAIQKDLLA